MNEQFDFSGWATRNDVRCADGRTIRQNAFEECDGQVVPLVWHHMHDSPSNILGHALLENRPEGVYAYGKFNDTQEGQTGKQLVRNGDIRSLSIYANKLKQKKGDVLHGIIREVSLVIAGANPEAYIDYPELSHSFDDDQETEAIIDMNIEPVYLEHSEKEEPEEVSDEETKEEKETEEIEEMAEEKLEHADKTVREVIDTLNEEQKKAVYLMLAQVASGNGDDEGEEEMKHNVFDVDQENKNKNNVLQHSDEMSIIERAKTRKTSLREAIREYEEDNDVTLAHDAISSGFDDESLGYLFPEYKDMRPGAPELITNDQTWVDLVLNGAHKSPMSRIRTQQVDIRKADQLRARGYEKGKFKKIAGKFSLARRTTDPQTIYVKSQLHRDDIVDITDFDYVDYLYKIDRMNIREELATAILFGDGREEEDEDKIHEDKIRPIWTDDDLYTIHYDIDKDGTKAELQGGDTKKYFGENYILAEAMVNACLYAKEQYKGSGDGMMLIEPHMLNVMLLARDRNGRRIYSSKSELATVLGVSSIHTVEQMKDLVRTAGEGADAKQKKLLALIVNMRDYNIGATKGGELTHFTNFDIDFNVEKSLLETRCSGALTRLWSAIAIEEDVTEEGPTASTPTLVDTPDLED